MMPYCYANGDIKEYEKARVSPGDISVLRGFAVFDFFRIYNKKPFCFDLHYKRFCNSADKFGLRVEKDYEELLTILSRLCTRNNCSNAQVRIILTGGETIGGIEPSKPEMIVLFDELKEYTDDFFSKGVKIITHSFQRSYPEAKTSQYVEAVLLQKTLKERGALEVLYIDEGIVRECSTSNIFIVKNNKLITPSNDILEGITRNQVIEIALANNLNLEIREVKKQELFDADEVFLTATNKKVMPVVKIDENMICDGRVGNVTKKIIDLYNKKIEDLIK